MSQAQASVVLPTQQSVFLLVLNDFLPHRLSHPTRYAALTEKLSLQTNPSLYVYVLHVVLFLSVRSHLFFSQTRFWALWRLS